MKGTLLSIFVAVILIGGALVFAKGSPTNQRGVDDSVNVNNVSIKDGVQTIDIRARGGYQPRKSTAKAGIPTILRFDSKGTFDCSASVRIPELNISRSLDFSGYTEISLGVQNPGVLKGSCSMGMYPFEIEFKS